MHIEGNPVQLASIRLPFWNMVRLLVEWILALFVATFILSLIFGAVGGLALLLIILLRGMIGA